MDRLEAMRTFAAVATLGSFTDVARQRGMSASAVTRSVAQLEDALGLVLLNRTTRSLRLTEKGVVYLESCRRILEDVDDAERRLRGQDAEPRGLLTVAAPVLFGRLHVLPIVNALLAAHPALSVRLSLSDRNVHLVEDGVDVAVRIGDLADSSLISLRLGEVSRVLLASPAYLAARGEPVTPADLAAHDIVAFEGLDATRDWRFAGKDLSARIAPRLTVNSAEAAIAAAEAGLGVTRALSYQARSAVEGGRLKLLLQPFAQPATPVSAIYPARRIGSANLSAFIKEARNQFKAAPLVPIEAWLASTT